MVRSGPFFIFLALAKPPGPVRSLIFFADPGPTKSKFSNFPGPGPKFGLRTRSRFLKFSKKIKKIFLNF